MNVLQNYEQRKFWVLVLIVSISGFSQGLLLPLISIIFERDGVSSVLNGFTATGIYIGTLLISPFVEAPLRRWGYKPIIILGGLVVIVSLMLFPLWKSVMFWFILRLLIGIGDHMLHFSTQTWITSTAKRETLGRSMAIYGLSFGVGFAVGPLFVRLIEISETIPFIVSSVLCLIAWLLVFTIVNEKPEEITAEHEQSSWKRYVVTFKFAWIAFIPSFAYGFLESSLNTLYAVSAIRIGLEVKLVSIILSAFAIGAIVTQLPLGNLGDKIGRSAVITGGFGIGAMLFAAASFFEQNGYIVLALFACAGMVLGSMYSLGITYMADLTPHDLLPTGNILCGIFFSLGSLAGPIIGGVYLDNVNASFLWLVCGFLVVAFVINIGKRLSTTAVNKQIEG
ncbi:MAG: MFS transporter [Lysinibacillus sp.]